MVVLIQDSKQTDFYLLHSLLQKSEPDVSVLGLPPALGEVSVTLDMFAWSTIVK